jgi:Transposase DDE domain
MGHLWDALCRASDAVGFDEGTGGDEVFRGPVLARIIEPTSKLDSLRVPAEVGVPAASHPTLNRRLPGYARPEWRRRLAAACAARAALGPATLVLYDVTTLYFETEAGDGFREPGFSKERRLEPQITVGLLTDAAGFPLQMVAFEGNKAETATMLPTIEAFKTAHRLTDITVVADGGMVSEANKRAIEAARLRVIVGGWQRPDAAASLVQTFSVFRLAGRQTGGEGSARQTYPDRAYLATTTLDDLWDHHRRGARCGYRRRDVSHAFGPTLRPRGKGRWAYPSWRLLCVGTLVMAREVPGLRRDRALALRRYG